MKIQLNGKEYDVAISVNTKPHQDISVEVTTKIDGVEKKYTGPFDVQKVHQFLEEKCS